MEIADPRLSASQLTVLRSSICNEMDEVELIRTELTPKLILIDPQSVFMRRWDIIMFVALYLLRRLLDVGGCTARC